jgi:rhodanese-related sulfurtransferase
VEFPDPDTLEIDCQQLQCILENDQPIRLVDCREREEWDICHLERAELRPLSLFGQQFAAGQITFSPEVPVIIY